MRVNGKRKKGRLRTTDEPCQTCLTDRSPQGQGWFLHAGGGAHQFPSPALERNMYCPCRRLALNPASTCSTFSMSANVASNGDRLHAEHQQQRFDLATVPRAHPSPSQQIDSPKKCTPLHRWAVANVKHQPSSSSCLTYVGRLCPDLVGGITKGKPQRQRQFSMALSIFTSKH